MLQYYFVVPGRSQKSIVAVGTVRINFGRIFKATRITKYKHRVKVKATRIASSPVDLLRNSLQKHHGNDNDVESKQTLQQWAAKGEAPDHTPHHIMLLGISLHRIRQKRHDHVPPKPHTYIKLPSLLSTNSSSLQLSNLTLLKVADTVTLAPALPPAVANFYFFIDLVGLSDWLRKKSFCILYSTASHFINALDEKLRAHEQHSTFPSTLSYLVLSVSISVVIYVVISQALTRSCCCKHIRTKSRRQERVQATSSPMISPTTEVNVDTICAAAHSQFLTSDSFTLCSEGLKDLSSHHPFRLMSILPPFDTPTKHILVLGAYLNVIAAMEPPELHHQLLVFMRRLILSIFAFTSRILALYRSIIFRMLDRDTDFTRLTINSVLEAIGVPQIFTEIPERDGDVPRTRHPKHAIIGEIIDLRTPSPQSDPWAVNSPRSGRHHIILPWVNRGWTNHKLQTRVVVGIVIFDEFSSAHKPDLPGTGRYIGLRHILLGQMKGLILFLEPSTVDSREMNRRLLIQLASALNLRQPPKLALDTIRDNEDSPRLYYEKMNIHRWLARSLRTRLGFTGLFGNFPDGFSLNNRLNMVIHTEGRAPGCHQDFNKTAALESKAYDLTGRVIYLEVEQAYARDMWDIYYFNFVTERCPIATKHCCISSWCIRNEKERDIKEVGGQVPAKPHTSHITTTKIVTLHRTAIKHPTLFLYHTDFICQTDHRQNSQIHNLHKRATRTSHSVAMMSEGLKNMMLHNMMMGIVGLFGVDENPHMAFAYLLSLVNCTQGLSKSYPPNAHCSSQRTLSVFHNIKRTPSSPLGELLKVRGISCVHVEGTGQAVQREGDPENIVTVERLDKLKSYSREAPQLHAARLPVTYRNKGPPQQVFLHHMPSKMARDDFHVCSAPFSLLKSPKSRVPAPYWTLTTSHRLVTADLHGHQLLTRDLTPETTKQANRAQKILMWKIQLQMVKSDAGGKCDAGMGKAWNDSNWLEEKWKVPQLYTSETIKKNGIELSKNGRSSRADIISTCHQSQMKKPGQNYYDWREITEIIEIC
ncbi:uncharacterized protein BDR25DRAFT_356839 [Lindgomyces ingoldianus]|uniref:Uncharacterized protein n=1 Tax=Lindgomyces ingoldianus TaxID=673940 RepID=A0ACB6QR80_9PLEO|nr:uncharacterized protein BDR25DRAFT_356839 [Lindgomyces ingoldianus]KAF2469073.1 hypothetical protein BDR25DRAFT_356839 [Lindgomyces ingoldianus]